MKKKYWIPTIVVVMLTLIVTASFYQKKNQNPFEKAPIVYIGEGDPGFPVIKYNIGDEIIERARFVLIHDHVKITKEDRPYFQKLIDEKRTILFFGDDIQKDTVPDRLGISFDGTTADANMEQYYTLFGYGYSFTNQKNMSLYLSSNNKGLPAASIQEFLYTQFTSF